MNDNELFELCREVYEKTEWEADDWWGKSAYSGEYRVVPDKQYEVKMFADEGDAGSFYDHLPHYTSDYLLEKLPASIASKESPGEYAQLITRKDEAPYDPPEFRQQINYFAWYSVVGVPDGASDFGVYADTPLKALLKLTLALHEAGELK